MRSEKTPEQVMESNARIVAERGPGLYWDTGTYVIARYPKAGLVLRGGLGGLGVGVMWQGEHDPPEAEPGWDESEVVETDERARELHYTFQDYMYVEKRGILEGGVLVKFRKDYDPAKDPCASGTEPARP